MGMERLGSRQGLSQLPLPDAPPQKNQLMLLCRWVTPGGEGWRGCPR